MLHHTRASKHCGGRGQRPRPAPKHPRPEPNPPHNTWRNTPAKGARPPPPTPRLKCRPNTSAEVTPAAANRAHSAGKPPQRGSRRQPPPVHPTPHQRNLLGAPPRSGPAALRLPSPGPPAQRAAAPQARAKRERRPRGRPRIPVHVQHAPATRGPNRPRCAPRNAEKRSQAGPNQSASPPKVADLPTPLATKWPRVAGCAARC